MRLRTIFPWAVVLVLALAGYMGVSALAVPAGAACLTIDSWRRWRLRRRSQHRAEPPGIWTSKTTTYFVTGVVADLGLAALAFAAGQVARALLG